MRALFRADASVSIGSGHIMRCLTLANALRRQGISCDFASRDGKGALHQLVTAQGFTLLRLPPCDADAGTEESDDAAQTLALLTQNYALLIVDHYALAARYCQQLRQRCRYILQIDDLANRPLDCDLLLDQNLLPDAASRYQQLVPPYCRQLLGPAYALLRDEFYQHSDGHDKQRILIGFGGSDAQNLTALAISALQQLKLTSLHADIVIGANNPWRTQLEQLVRRLPNAQLHVQCDYMAKLMHQARLMLGAGGSSHWERCICGLPGLVVTVAENQQATTAYLDQLGACVWLGQAADMTAECFAEQLCYHLSQPDLLARISRQASAVVPADAGTPRVAAEVIALLRGNNGNN